MKLIIQVYRVLLVCIINSQKNPIKSKGTGLFLTLDLMFEEWCWNNPFYPMIKWFDLNIFDNDLLLTSVLFCLVCIGDIDMIQSDVILKGQDTEHQSLFPVMARLPDTSSELTLDDWLTEVRRAVNKGVKVSFQSNDAVEITLQKLKDSKRGVFCVIFLYWKCTFYLRNELIATKVISV